MLKVNYTRFYVYAISLVCAAALAYVYAMPPESLRVTRDGVPFFTPPVVNPESGEPLDMGELVRHFKGE